MITLVITFIQNNILREAQHPGLMMQAAVVKPEKQDQRVKSELVFSVED